MNRDNKIVECILKLDIEKDSEIIKRLESVADIESYIHDLVVEDMKKENENTN